MVGDPTKATNLATGGFIAKNGHKPDLPLAVVTAMPIAAESGDRRFTAKSLTPASGGEIVIIAHMSARIGFVASFLTFIFMTGVQPTALAQIIPGEAPVEVRVAVAPAPATVNGQLVVAYELIITNLLPREISLNRIEVLGDDSVSKPIVIYQEKELVQAIRQYGPPSQPVDTRRIPGGFRAIVYMWVTIERPPTVPLSLRHKLLFSVPTADGKIEERHLDIAGLKVSRTTTTVISAPFRDGSWIAGNGPANTSIHRRASVLAGGGSYMPERFAIDWMKLGVDGKVWHDDRSVNANYYCYGTEVLAVADGVVASIKDGIPENTPFTSARAVPITMDTIGGNFVFLQLGNGRYAFYAHLQPGSLRVKPGDRVRRGQVLGLLGNSGNSDAPHLHFHMSDGDSLTSEGVPYGFDSFEVLGTTNADQVFTDGWKPATGTKPLIRVHEIPAENEVVRFAPR